MQPIKSFIGVGLLLAATSSVYAATDSSGVWTTCAGEGATCSFTGTQAVRYGASGKYSTGTFKGSVSCSNTVFGDPAPGVVKSCEVLSPTQVPAGYAWTTCANENQTCTLSGIKAVRYGASGSYYSGSFNNTATCSNSVFGDPAGGVVKACDALTAVTSTSTSTSGTTITDASGVWTQCAKEYGSCTFTGTKAVKYGANGNYLSASFTSSVSCGNSAFGSDPAAGVTKACYLLTQPVAATSTSTSGTSTTDATGTWTQCASEYGTCTFTGTKSVKFGANGSYLTGSFTTSVSCKSGSFGSDPAVGVTKACYLLTTAATTTVAPTTTTSSSTTTTSGTTTTATTGTTTTTSSTTVPASGTAWTLCAKLNDHCSFTGTKVVKSSDPNDATRTAYRVYTNGAYCDNYRCEIDGPVPYLPVASTPYVDATKIPVGLKGSAVELSKVATQTANPTEYGPANTDLNITGGAFRLGCGYTHMSFDDPIRYPGQKGAAKLTTYMGNPTVDYTTTASTITNSTSEACEGGGVFNKTAYYSPSMIDTRDGTPIAPAGVTTYYKSGYYATTIVPPPTGLRMIAGDDPVISASNIGKTAHWHCARPGLDILASGEHDSIPTDCLAGDLYVNVVFPVCWDGVNLDSPNHRSHMAYPFVGGPQGGSTGICPVTHPVLLPSITENIHYTVKNDGDTKYWRLSTDAYPTTTPGGLSMSGSWFMGWNVAVMKQITKTCINGMRDCHSNFLPGNGNLIDPSLPSYGRDLLPTQ